MVTRQLPNCTRVTRLRVGCELAQPSESFMVLLRWRCEAECLTSQLTNDDGAIRNELFPIHQIHNLPFRSCCAEIALIGSDKNAIFTF